MPLLAFWESNREAVEQLSIEQVVTNAGDGNLKDNSDCAIELRTFLTKVSTEKIARYVDQCLASSLVKGGLVLQDLVNELGRRLEYKVTNGRYQGISGGIGFDGLWRSTDGYSVVVEVKTTDAYRLSLDTLARYRRKLIEAAEITDDSSILIVVGRQDTGELEAQIRGSRQAWDVRLISAEALLKLVILKENAETPLVGAKIRGLLRPVEYTRLDALADVMFDTIAEVDAPPSETGTNEAGAEQADESDAAQKSAWQFTDSNELQAKRLSIIAALSKREGVELGRKSRALYASLSGNVRAACAMSKRYKGSNPNAYWYAFHPQWDEFLAAGEKSYFVLGCMDKNEAYAIDHSVLKKILPLLNTTTPKDGSAYWHIHLREQPGNTLLVVPKGDAVDLAPFTFEIA